MKVTNNGTAPRGLYVNGVIKLIAPGATRDLELEGVELEQAQKVETLSFDEPVKAAKGKPKADATDAE